MDRMYKTCMTFITECILNISSFSDASIFLSFVLQQKESAFTCILLWCGSVKAAPWSSVLLFGSAQSVLVGQHKKAVLP